MMMHNRNFKCYGKYRL